MWLRLMNKSDFSVLEWNHWSSLFDQLHRFFFLGGGGCKCFFTCVRRQKISHVHTISFKNMKNVYVCTVSDGFSSTASKFKNPKFIGCRFNLLWPFHIQIGFLLIHLVTSNPAFLETPEVAQPQICSCVIWTCIVFLAVCTDPSWLYQLSACALF